MTSRSVAVSLCQKISLRYLLLIISLFLMPTLPLSAQVGQPVQGGYTPGPPQGQKKDTIPRKIIPGGKTFYTSMDDMVELPGRLRPVDTLQDHIQQFDAGYLHNLGNNGTPAFPLFYDPLKSPGFDLGLHQWDLYRYKAHELPFFHTQNPYTELYYVQGSKELQKIRGVHTQNIRPNWNFSLQFIRMTSRVGFYSNQVTSSYNAALNTSYYSLSRRYLLQAQAAFNEYEAQENGGMRYDTLFPLVSAGERIRLPVQLANARQIWNDYDVLLRQYIYFGPKKEQHLTDTGKKVVSILQPRFFLTHSIEFFQDHYFYKDTTVEDLKNFPARYFDSTVTRDRFMHHVLTNEAGIGYQKSFSPPKDTSKNGPKDSLPASFFAELYGRYSLINVKELTESSNFTNQSFGFRTRKSGKVCLESNGEYFLQGYNQGDYRVEGSVYQWRSLGSLNLGVKAKALQQSAEPSYMEQHMISNHFLWFNRFNKIQNTEVSGSLLASLPHLSGWNASISVKYNGTQNPVYFGADAMPHQSDTIVHYLQAGLQLNFRLGPVYFENNLWHQQVLQGNFIHLPEFLARSSWYVHENLFRNHLRLRTGIDFYYNSAYYSDAYMPELSRFYLQNSVLTGNYPLFDVWLSGSIQRFLFFFKVEHVTEGLFGNAYYLLPHYPIEPRTFRFGIRWLFYN